MFLFNLLLLVALRDRMYLWYLAGLTSLTLTVAEQNGLGKEFLWPNSPYWSLVAINIGYMLSVLTLSTFMRRMLDTAVTMPRLDRAFQLLSGLLLCGVLGLLLNTERVAPVISWLGLIGFSSIMVCGLYGIVLRLRSAYFFVAAYSFLLVGAVMYALRNLSLLSNNSFFPQAVQIGSALEMIVLALALADRFFQIRLQNVRMNKEALAAQTQLVEVLKSSEQQLEQRVTRRTDELSTVLQRLQTAQAHLVDSERRAIQGERKALDALAAQQHFIAMVSHELRSPLAVIDHSAQLLANNLPGPPTSKAAKLVVRIRRGTERLTQFLDTCLTQDRLRDVGLQLKTTALDVAALALSVRESAQQLTDQHRIVRDLQSGLPPLQADAELLRILLANLLGNAIKYSEPGREICLRVTHVDDRHIFEVIDQGCGIPADEIPHLFKKYRRGRLTANKPGAGLGLALCWQIVQLHGGHIHVESTQGVGTRVVVELPEESSADAHTSQFE
jgi:signal transduction histidine kinase